MAELWSKTELCLNLEPDQSTRKNLADKFVKNSDDEVENIIRLLFFELLPICYLEGLKELEKKVHQQPWPKSPKFIFTSNNFELMKF